MLGFFIYWLPWVVQRSVKRAVLMGLAGALIVFLERYLLLPADVTWNLVLGFAVNALLAGVIGLAGSFKEPQAAKWDSGRFGLGLVGLLATLLATATPLHSKAYATLGQVVDLPAGQEDRSEIDLGSIITVPVESAYNKAKQVTGQYGAQFSLGHAYVQRVAGKLTYIVPLEFQGLTAQMSAGDSPGYISVSATDIFAAAEPHLGLHMHYMESAFFSQNLERHLRAKYPGLVFLGNSFEVDDAGQPFHALSVGRYGIGSSGAVITGVLLVNPQTGADSFYTLDQVPAWVDQVVPPAIVANYVRWWGEYQGGFWNRVLWKRGVKIPTVVSAGGQEMAGVNGPDGRFSYFTGMTSPSTTDTSLIGMAYADARTGKIHFQEVKGMASEEHIQQVVENLFKAQRYTAGYPLPYTMYGRITWVAPVIDSKENGQLIQVGIVSLDGNSTGFGKDLEEAVRKFKATLGKQDGGAPAAQAVPVHLTGTVARIAQVATADGTVFYLLLKEAPGKVFVVALDRSPYLPLTQLGDSVALTYAETGEQTLPVTQFQNQTVH